MKYLTAGLVMALLSASAFAQASTGPIDSTKAEVLTKLNNMKVDLSFEETPLRGVIAYLREFTGLNFVISAEVGEALSDEELNVTLKVRDLRLKSALKLMLDARGLTASYKNGVILIIPKDSQENATVYLQIYDVRDVLVKIQDFPGPVVELASPADISAATGPLVGAVFALEESDDVMTPDFIVEMIEVNTGGNTWGDLPNASVTLSNGMLIVSQSRRVHREIHRLINLLRQFK